MLIPLNDQIACLDREIALRQRVYPHLVATGKMTEVKAQYELVAMEAVRETLLGLLGKEGAHGQMPLFGRESHA